jgi:uncharacterized SAM-binding protein YcdF (DUF218 family)
MFYAASKIGFFIVQPSNIFLALAILGVILSRGDRFRRLGGRLAGAGVAGLLIGGLSPLGNAIILPLEERFPRPTLADLGPAIDGIIILGGFEEGRLTVARQALSLNEAAERLTEAVSLARRFPTAKVVFTGGAGTLIGKGDVAAQEVRDFLVDAGVERERIILEDASRNTRENATLTHDLVKPRAGSRWVLVTSAFHMPRSIAVFRRAGFDCIAWPVDYRTAGAGDLVRFFDSIDNGLRRIDVAAKEYVGLIAYRLSGWTDSVWPGPAVVSKPAG